MEPFFARETPDRRQEGRVLDSIALYMGLLLLALFVAVLETRLAGLPYTIGLVAVGLVVGMLGVAPSPREAGFGRDLVFFVLLPPLLFQGALHLDFNRLLAHFWPILLFAIAGVAVSTLALGGVIYLAGGFQSLLVALLLGSMLSATDPVSVLALFKKAGVSEDLRHVMEGESLFNDGTAVVLFGLLYGLVRTGGTVDPPAVVLGFLQTVGGGLLTGAVLGYLTYLFMRSLDDPLVETTACLVLALGSFWVAEHLLHLSGVIATVTAGLFIGNYGPRLSMSPKVKVSLNSFFEVVDFIINSIIFLMIGLEIREVGLSGLLSHLGLVGAAVVAMLASRALVVYTFYPALNLAGRKRPGSWAHVLFWGGLRGSIPVALLLGLPPDFPHRDELLVAGFGVVLFSLLVQGLTVKPLLARLGLQGGAEGEGGAR